MKRQAWILCALVGLFILWCAGFLWQKAIEPKPLLAGLKSWMTHEEVTAILAEQGYAGEVIRDYVMVKPYSLEDADGMLTLHWYRGRLKRTVFHYASPDGRSLFESTNFERQRTHFEDGKRVVTNESGEPLLISAGDNFMTFLSSLDHLEAK